MWETRVVVGGRFPSPVGRRGLIAAFHRTSASIARSLIFSGSISNCEFGREPLRQPVLDALGQAVEIANADGAEVDRPDALVDREQPDVCSDENVASED